MPAVARPFIAAVLSMGASTIAAETQNVDTKIVAALNIAKANVDTALTNLGAAAA